jgi:hypothetical protein
MHLIDGRYQCVLCGAVLDIGPDDPREVIVASSGKPNMRALVLGGKELHRCAADPTVRRPAPRP